MAAEIILSDGQQAALDKFCQFLYTKGEQVFVLAGYSGTGKSTLVHTLLDRLPSFIKAAQLIQSDFPEYAIQLTATTNKAAETFARITGMDVTTIHKFLGLRLKKDIRTGFSTLVPSTADTKSGYLLFIDEASMVDSHLLGLIFGLTSNCKIVFIGDPAQLAPVKMTHAPVFKAGFKTAELTEVRRTLGPDGKPAITPITELSTAFRNTVNTNVWTRFKPDGEYVLRLPRDEFNQAMEAEFTRDDWHFSDSKVLAWTNNCVIQYNKHIRSLLKGDPALQAGDYAENNSFIMTPSRASIKTDQTVYISEMGEDTEEFGVLGNWVVLDYAHRVFHPRYRKDKQKKVNELRAQERFKEAEAVDNWIDLRAVFAQTVNKSQGSTYGKVFIDLDDIGRCNSGNQIARMLYVAVSRAQHQVILTGDLV